MPGRPTSCRRYRSHAVCGVPAGFFQDQPGQAGCLPCAPGRFNVRQNQSEAYLAPQTHSPPTLARPRPARPVRSASSPSQEAPRAKDAPRESSARMPRALPALLAGVTRRTVPAASRARSVSGPVWAPPIAARASWANLATARDKKTARHVPLVNTRTPGENKPASCAQRTPFGRKQGPPPGLSVPGAMLTAVRALTQEPTIPPPASVDAGPSLRKRLTAAVPNALTVPTSRSAMA